MKIKILGSGGVKRIPKPCCSCRICNEAREKGIPHERLGTALLVNDNILIDASEDIFTQLNKHNVSNVDHILFSHWHPDHTGGARVIEVLNKPNVYIASKEDFEKVPSLSYFEETGLCTLNIVNEIKIDGIKFKFIQLGNKFAYAILITEGNKSVLFCPCHCMHLPVVECDVLIMNLGSFEEKEDITSYERDNLRLIKEINPTKTIFMHIEEHWGKSYDEYCEMETDDMKFGYDGMEFNV